jgi:hypothetical protein
MLDIDGRTQSADILRDIVTEDDTPHRRLAGSALAHQQHFALLLTLDRIHLEYGNAIDGLMSAEDLL